MRDMHTHLLLAASLSPHGLHCGLHAADESREVGQTQSVGESLVARALLLTHPVYHSVDELEKRKKLESRPKQRKSDPRSRIQRTFSKFSLLSFPRTLTALASICFVPLAAILQPPLVRFIQRNKVGGAGSLGNQGKITQVAVVSK